MDTNLAIITGRLGADPNMHTFEGGDKKATLSVATSRKYKNQSDELKEETEWHTVVLFGSSAVFAEQWLKRGDLVAVQGRLATRSWGDPKRYSTEIIASNIQKYWPPKDDKPVDDVMI